MTAPLVSEAELAEALAGKAAPLLLDVRFLLVGPQPGEYEQAHLPGAVFCDLDAVLAGPPGAGGRHPLPPPADLARAVAALGVSATRPVVAYDAGEGGPGAAIAAARAWWCLRWLGHRDVRVLDGGLATWTRAGRAVEAGWVAPVPAVGDSGLPAADFPAMPVLDADGAARVARSGVLLDARTPERFRGETEPVDPVAGHIPGAVNAPVPAQAATLVGDRKPAGAYCGSGVTAAALVLALEAAGRPGVALYPGSWSEWITDPRRPIATGP